MKNIHKFPKIPIFPTNPTFPRFPAVPLIPLALPRAIQSKKEETFQA